MNIVCECGKGYASSVDRLCIFCRAKTFRSAQIRAIGRSPSAGLTLDDADRIRKLQRINKV